MSDKCPNCGANRDPRRTTDAKALRPRNQWHGDDVVWACGRATWSTSDTWECLRRQLAQCRAKNERLRATNERLYVPLYAIAHTLSNLGSVRVQLVHAKEIARKAVDACTTLDSLQTPENGDAKTTNS